MNWGVAKIAKACLPTRMRDPRRNPDKSFLYVDISAIDRSLKVITSAPEIIGSEAPSRARKEIREGDVLVSTVRPNLNAVTIVPPELDGQIASTGFCVLRPNRSVLESKYLFYFTLTSDFIGILTNKVRGAHYPAVSDGDVKEIELPLIPPSEQRRIVEILDQADALRMKRSGADAKAARILAALFYKIIGDPAKNPNRWPMNTLREISLGQPQYGANSRAIEYQEGAPRYVRITDISDDGRLSNEGIKTLEIDDWQAYRLHDGDLLFARSGATVGKTYLYQPEDGLCAFAGYLIRFQLNRKEVEPLVVFAFTQTPYYQSWVASKKRAAAQPNINGQEYASLTVPKPSQKAQQLFTEAARNVRSMFTQRQQAAGHIENLFTLLLHRAFIGDLTAKWREAHMKELLAEMEIQAKLLGSEGRS